MNSDLDALGADLSVSSWAVDFSDGLQFPDALVELSSVLPWAVGDALPVSESEPTLWAAELALVRWEGGGVLLGVLDFPGDGLPLVGDIALVDDGGGYGLAGLVVGGVFVRAAAERASLLRGPHPLERPSAVESRREDAGRSPVPQHRVHEALEFRSERSLRTELV